MKHGTGAVAVKYECVSRVLTSPPTQYRLSGRQFYRSKDPSNSIKVLKEKVKYEEQRMRKG